MLLNTCGVFLYVKRIFKQFFTKSIIHDNNIAMNKFILTILVVAASTFAYAQSATKLSPLTKQYVKSIEAGVLNEQLLYKKDLNGKQQVGALIKVSDASKAVAGIAKLGIHVNTKAGNIWTVKIPVNQLIEFTKIEGIAYIQLDEPVRPQLNVVRTNTRVDSVYKGIDLPKGFSGKDVVVGVIDFGFDYNHPSFYDTLGSRYRVKRIWEVDRNGTPPAGFNYGHEIKDTNEMKTAGTDNAAQTHGAMVAGVAVGSGFGSTNNNRYRGIAYDADIVFVGVRRDSIEQQWLSGGFSDFLDGISYILRYAGSVNKPVVVNISWGSQSGPHDGTTLFNEACDNLANAGRIIVMSAGNDGEEKIHLSKTFSANDTLLQTFLHFSPSTYKRTWIDMWGEKEKNFCASVSLFNNGIETHTTDFVCIDDEIHDTLLINNNNDTCSVQFITSLAEYNGKPRLTINLYNKTTDSVLVKIKANDGTIHLWNEYYYYGYTHRFTSSFESYGFPWAATGNTETTVSDMGSSNSVLLVGAHVSKSTWRDINNMSWNYGLTVGAIAPFSSRGPLTNGQTKPDFTAPGLTMGTAVSSFEQRYTPTGALSQQVVGRYTDPSSSKTYYFAEFTGTSASAPVASGIVALMLEANPGLAPSQVKEIIQQTAIQDNRTGNLPPEGDNTFGHGKINGYAAVKMATQVTGLYRFGGEKLDVVVYPNPSEGKFVLDYTARNNQPIHVEVFDVTGNRVFIQLNVDVQTGQNYLPIHLSNLSKGLYFVKVNATSGTGVATIKLLIQ
jgi:minor extracellular serine protease Vpr